MKKTVLTLLLCALFGSASWLHGADCSTMAGGVAIVIPTPDTQ